MRLRPSCLVAVALLLPSCTPSKSATTSATSVEPLIGDWLGPELPKSFAEGSASASGGPALRPASCAREIELFADGTMEANWLSDDSVASRCSFGLLEWSVNRSATPPVLIFGVDPAHSAAVPFAIDGELLHLEPVEHHREAEMDAPLRRTEATPSSPELLNGAWIGEAFWGPPSAMTIGEGRFVLRAGQVGEVGEVGGGGAAPREGRMVVHDEHTLDLMGDGLALRRCLYRVSARRLSMSCTSGDSYPQSFTSAATGALTTTVWTRAKPA